VLIWRLHGRTHSGESRNPDIVAFESAPGLIEKLQKRIIRYRLDYSYRIKSDYDAIPIDGENLEQLLKVVAQLLEVIDEKGGK